MKRLREAVEEKEHPLTYEIYSPMGWAVDQHLRSIADFKDKIDAVNIPDNPLARLKVSPIAYTHVLMENLKVDAVPHITCRDRNVLALQSEILGAYLLGVRNVFLVSGDPAAVSGFKTLKEVR